MDKKQVTNQAKKVLKDLGIGSRAGNSPTAYGQIQKPVILVKKADIEKAKAAAKEAGLDISVLADPDEDL